MIIISPVELAIPEDIVGTNVPADAVPPASPEDELRYQMFLPVSNQVTTSQANILVEIKPTQRWDTLMLFNVGADRMVATIKNGPAWTVDMTLRYDAPLTPDLLNEPNVYLEVPEVDPAVYPWATLVVNLWVTMLRQTSCELLAVGWRVQIGRALYGTELSIQDYSLKRRDEYGALTLIERGYNDQVRYRLELGTDDVAWVRELLADRRAKPTGYLGSSEVDATYVFGLYQDFTIPVEGPAVCVAELTVGSVVRTGATDTDLPNTFQAVFLPLEPGCIEDHEGFLAKLVLNDDGELGDQQVMVGVELGRALLEGETYEWIIEWDSEEDPPNTGSSAMLVTSCDQHFVTYTWPTGSVEPMAPCIATISLVFHQLDGAIQASNAVVLVIQNRLEGPCTEFTVDARWLDRSTGEYALTEVFGALGYVDVRALALRFDEDWYLAQNPDVAAEVGDKSQGAQFNSAYEHYWVPGDLENRQPNRWFDPAYYKANNPDVVAALYPAVPAYFYNSLEHYQMFGYGEGRLPCSPAMIASADIVPVGAFHWQAKTGTDGCGAGECETDWDVQYTGVLMPRVTVVDNVVTVTADIQDGLQTTSPVDPGTLTLTPTVQCPAAYPGGPVPDPIVLDPITLKLCLIVSGWDVGGVLQDRINEDNYSGKTWVARVDGAPPGFSTAWSYAWTSRSSGDSPSVAVVNGVLTVINAQGGGTLRAVATVAGSGATQSLAPIFLVLGAAELSGPVTVGALTWENPAGVYADTALTKNLQLFSAATSASPTLCLFAQVDGAWRRVADLLGQSDSNLILTDQNMQAYAQQPMAVAALSPSGVWLPRAAIGGVASTVAGQYAWTISQTAVAIGAIEGWMLVQPADLGSSLYGKLTISADWQYVYGEYRPVDDILAHAKLAGTSLDKCVITWSSSFSPWDGYAIGLAPSVDHGIGPDVTLFVSNSQAVPPGQLALSAQVRYQGNLIATRGPIILNLVPGS